MDEYRKSKPKNETNELLNKIALDFPDFFSATYPEQQNILTAERMARIRRQEQREIRAETIEELSLFNVGQELGLPHKLVVELSALFNQFGVSVTNMVLILRRIYMDLGLELTPRGNAYSTRPGEVK